MNKKLKEKIKESLSAVLPISAIVLMISIFLVPMETGTVTMFMAGAVMLIIGMGFFQLGAEMSMSPLGEGIGIQLSKSKRIILIIAAVLAMGFMITIAEPDLAVLASQVPAIPNQTLIWTVAIGVALCLMLAVLRVLFRFKLSTMLMILYGIVILLAFITPDNFRAVAFDAGGATTGPISVPFILAVGVGLSAARSDKNAGDDSFGLVAISSTGPILAVMLLGIFYHPTDAAYTPAVLASVVTMQDVFREFLHALPIYAKEVLLSIIPVVIMYLFFQLLSKRYQRRERVRIIIGFIYTDIGLVLFLTGVNIGFSPVGSIIGAALAGSRFKWLLIPIGMLIGYFIVKAEPAIQVLNKQVESVTSGTISAVSMNRCLSIGVAASVGLAMIRSITGISIMWIIVPGYLLALILSRIVPPIFVGIAFDSGGVASGPMTSTFLLPLCIGVCEALGGNIMTDAFGAIALVALTPLIAVQLMGLIYKIKAGKSTEETMLPGDEIDEIMDWEEECINV